MRFMGLGMGLAVVLAAASASAAGGVGGKGDVGGKGGPGPSNTQAGADYKGSVPSPLDTSQQGVGGTSTANPDTTAHKAAEEKPWEVSATYELHRLIRQEDLGGAGVSKVFDLLYIAGSYSLTAHDTVLISAGVTQNFLADAAESGFRATDISLAYSRGVDLPYEMKLAATAGLTLPISFYSQLATNITTPSLTVSLSRKFGDLSVQALVRGMYFWDKYTTSAEIGAGTGGSSNADGSGQPNPKWAAGGTISAEYDMPFHRPLSLGLALTDSYIWYYDVGQPPYNSTFYGAVQDPQFTGQPMQQSYGGEIYARYVMPDLSGVKSNITLALANGDPSLGYPDVLHDGIVHPYLLYRDTAEVYFAFQGQY